MVLLRRNRHSGRSSSFTVTQAAVLYTPNLARRSALSCPRSHSRVLAPVKEERKAWCRPAAPAGPRALAISGALMELVDGCARSPAAAGVAPAAAPSVAPAAAAAAASPGGMAALIEQREQELAQLRVDSLRSLEQQASSAVNAHKPAVLCRAPTTSCFNLRFALRVQLGQRDDKIRELQAKMLGLQADFEYNLGLLEGRDTELAGAEASLTALRGELASKVQLIQQMQAALAEAEQGELHLQESGNGRCLSTWKA